MNSVSNRVSKNDLEMTPPSLRWMKLFLLLLTVEGFLSVLASFAVRSMDRRAVAFGYSSPRLIFVAGFFGLDLILAIITAWAFVRPVKSQQILGHIARTILVKPNHLVLVLFVLLYMVIIGCFSLFLFMSPFLPSSFYPFHMGVERFFIAIVWVVSIPAQLFLALIIRHTSYLKLTLTRSQITRQSLLVVILTITSLHWITLVLKANWMSAIPGWFWYFASVNKFHVSFLFLLAAGLVAFLTTLVILHKPDRLAINLLICIGLGYVVQVLFGFASGNGFESIRTKYITPGPSDEVRYVCVSQAPLVASIRNYEPMYGVKEWYGTKPPGLASFYTIFRDAMKIFNPKAAKDTGVCFDAITRVSAYILPLVAALVLIIIYFLDKFLSGITPHFLSGILFILAPNFLMMTLLPDQFLFPLLFTIVVLVTGVAIKQKSFVLGLLAGALIYIVTFVSFSLLPVVGLVVAWIVMDRVISKGPRNDFRLALMILAICLGIGILWAGGLVFLKYDPVSRYMAAFSSHREIKEFTFSISNLFQYTLLNNVEFAFWSGVPLFILMVVGCIRSVFSAFLGKATKFDVLSIAFFLTYLATNFIGQTRGEVGRLWIFFLPIGSIIALKEALKLMKDPMKGVFLVFALQFVTSCLIFYVFNWL
jgi:hypothetical protein